MIKRTLTLAVLAVALCAPASARALWASGGAHSRGPVVKLLSRESAHVPSSTVLVGPDGQPVGGRWQHWVDEVRVPTVGGRLLFEASAARCGGAAACSAMPPLLETFVSPDQSRFEQRDELYFELGHDFDWQRLTNHDRRFLARLWGVPNAPWFDSLRGLQQGAEDGLEADFAAAYQSCAWGQFEIGGIMVIEPDQATVQAPSIYPADATATCRFIERVGARHSQLAAVGVALAHRNGR